MKKSLFSIALMLIGLSLNAQYAYVSEATGFATVSTGVRNVSLVDTNVLWIATYDGSGGMANRTDYSRTIDGGATWIPGTTGAPASYNWSMIYAHNADTAWSMYYNSTAGAPVGGAIYFTGDGGANWVVQDSINGDPVNKTFGTGSFPDVVHFWDGLNGIAFGDPIAGEFEIYTTIDGGNSWTPVDPANIPDPLNANEYGIVAHYSVVGDHIWFDTNAGRVYSSVDRGLNWTVASTGITVPAQGAIDICFYDANNGIARLYDGATGTNIMKTSNDAGATWNAATPTGNFFGGDLKYVPGTVSKLMSTGATTGFVGTSFSDDGGLTWVDLETAAQRTAIGVYDSIHFWAGGFTTSAFSDGIYHWRYVPQVLCNDPLITAGVSSASDSILCPYDTLIVTSTGVYAPNFGTYSGVSWIVSTADISNNSDPLNDPSVVLLYGFNNPAPANSFRTFINDGALIGGNLAFGTYYWTPVVFGNATAQTTPPQFLNDLLLDPSCTHTGTSLMIQVLDGTSPLCQVGIPETTAKELSISGSFGFDQYLNLTIGSNKTENATVKVTDVTGRLVFEKNTVLAQGDTKENINASKFGAGLYIIQVETAHGNAFSKIVKQ